MVHHFTSIGPNSRWMREQRASRVSTAPAPAAEPARHIARCGTCRREAELEPPFYYAPTGWAYSVLRRAYKCDQCNAARTDRQAADGAKAPI
jgi:hypothetical protein